MRIVLVRLSALGDIVHTWPLAEAIRLARPDDHLTWVVEKPLADLVEGHPAIDAVITVSTKRWRKQPFSAQTRAEIAALKSRFSELQPDLTIDAQGTLKSALVTKWTAADRRVGLARPWRRELVAGFASTETIPGSLSHRHVVATNLELARAVDVEPPPEPTPPDGRWLIEKTTGMVTESPRSGPYAIVLPGAGQSRKILPTTTLAETAKHLVGIDLEVIVAWGPGERDRALEIVELGGAGVHLAPPTGIAELAVLLGSAAVAVGGDTGPVHLAASLRVPTVGVHLTTDPARNGPLGDRTAAISGASPGRGPGGSATTGPSRGVSASEICAAIDGLLRSQE
jgi:heptosyltransferase-1